MARPATVWTPDRVAKLAELWADKSILARDIAAYFGVQVKSLGKIRARLGLPPRHYHQRPRRRKPAVVVHLPASMLRKPAAPQPCRLNPFVSEIPWPTKQRMMAGR